ncbi:FtsX-like permease family protein [Thermodesulfobacteriota bacterium]
MFQNYFVTALRFFSKNKLITFINIFGLALGITCALLVFLFIQYELTVDQFYEKIDRLYNLIIVGESKDVGQALEYRKDIDYKITPELLQNYPEITNVVRIMNWAGRIDHKKQHVRENRFWFCDPNIFDVLTLPLKRGNPLSVFQAPNSVVITPAMAVKYFGEEDPIGKTFKMLMYYFPVSYTFTVTGILEPLPETTSYKIDFLAYIPFKRIPQNIKEFTRQQEETVDVEIFIELADSSVYESLQKKLGEIEVQGFYRSMSMKNMHYQLEAFKNAYLTSKATYYEPNAAPYLKDEVNRSSDIQLLIFLASLGGIILIVSCINIVNLSTAQATLRVKEIGVRKVIGAKRRQLILQFIIESVVLSYIALLFALLLTELLLPSFNTLIHRELAVHYFKNWGFVLGVLCIATFTGILSGIYPAFVLSSFKPITTLKGVRLKSSTLLRKGLMITQIGVCAAVFIFPLVMVYEIKALKNRDIGFNPNNLIFFQVEDKNLSKRYLAFKKEILRIPGVTHMTASNFIPWQFGFMLSFSFFNRDVASRTQTLSVDTSFMETYQIPVVDGKGFRTELVENTGKMIINETARKLLQSSGNDPLFKSIGTFSASFWRHRVVGIMKDFYCFYPTQRIKPLALLPSRWLRMGREFMTIRLAENSNRGVPEKIEKTFKRFFPKSPFEYKYVAKEMEKMHVQKLGYRWMALVFATGFALFIAGVGLFGFATYETKRCTKEIGIRKALGAKPTQIALQFMIRFSKLALIANVISWPICHFAIQQILRFIDYPYPIKISFIYFLYAGFLTLFLTIVTVWIQTYRAAWVDPVKALRYE